MKSRQRHPRVRRFLGVLFLVSFTVCLWLGQVSFQAKPLNVGQAVTAQTPNPDQLVQQGIDRYQIGDIQSAIAHWQTALNTYRNTNNLSNQAIVLENLARGYQAIGQTNQAIAHWEQANVIYLRLKDLPQLGRSLTEQAQVYSQLGQYREAITLLCGTPASESCAQGSAIEIAHSAEDRSGLAAAMGSLGEAYRLKGNYLQATQYLQQSLELAQQLNNPLYISSALNSLGNTYTGLAQLSYRRAKSAERRGDTLEAENLRRKGLDYNAQALKSFQSGLTLAQQQNHLFNQMRSLLGTIASYYRAENTSAAKASLQQALSLLEQLPNSQDKVYAAIDLTHLLQPIQQLTSSRVQCSDQAISDQAEPLLQQAITTAQQISDPRSESFALGELGHVYECRGNYEQALKLSQQARWAAEQDLRAKDSLYLWEWQTGRILRAQGKRNEAIAAYEQAIATLEDIRSDLLTANRDLQFDFRDEIDPVYRELVELRLDLEQLSAKGSTSAQNKQNATPVNPNLSAALSTLDSLKLAELQNYFGNDCVITALSERVDVVGSASTSAVFSSVILGDRTAIIVNFPNGQQQLEWLDVDSDTLVEEINTYRRSLERFFDDFDPQQAQKIYDWLIQPFAANLEQSQVDTLVFIQDGILRTVPMAALHDGEQFLVQRYAIATTPSLTLTDPRPINRQNLRALALGLTESTTIEGQTFPPLENVAQEISAIKAELPGTKPLLNQDFTRDRLKQELDQEAYPILHMATHGEFGTEPQDTFLVTGDGQKLTITDLDQIIRSTKKGRQIDLLSLTACQTATGDDRSALGLAGVAIQAGARSALASLWFVDDAATANIADQFYANLQNPEFNKAEALRAAQIAVIETGGPTAHPAYWAPFILIGNWL